MRIIFNKTIGFRCLIVLATLLFTFSWSHTVFADLTEDAKSIYGDSVYYDPTSIGSTTPCTPSGGTPSGSGSVYFVGDSIGVGIKPDLGTALSGAGWQLGLSDSLSSRTLSGGSVSPDGLGAVDQPADQAAIKAAKAVVVELGTNTGGFSAANVSAMIGKIKALNSAAAIYWVDTVVVSRPGYTASLNGVNSIIYSQATTNNYKVISWAKKVLGDTAVPTSMPPGAPDPNGFINNGDGLGVHPSAKGAAAMADLIAKAVTTGGNSCGGASCNQAEVKDNKIKIWTYLISAPRSLTPPQAAGIMGNLQAESHFDPAIEQKSGSWNDMSNASGRAVGIAQWDGGRRPTLISTAKSQGKDPKDLCFQLDYLYNESLHRKNRDNPNLGEWDGLKLVPDAPGAAYYWHRNFERSSDGPEKIQGRSNNAVAILAELGSITGSNGAGGSP